MTGRTPRTPIDLAATTRGVKARVRRVIADLERIEQQRETLFPTRMLFGWTLR
jgi:hypothetical protein